jgi:hypothetical protein
MKVYECFQLFFFLKKLYCKVLLMSFRILCKLSIEQWTQVYIVHLFKSL